MKLTIGAKLIGLLTGLTLIVLFVVLAAINQVFFSAINDDVVLDFTQLQSFIQLQQNLQYQRLVESAFLIGENSTFKANVELADPASVDVVVEQFAELTRTPLFVVTDRNGIVLSWFGEQDSTGANISHRPSIQRSLAGNDPDPNFKWPDIWAIENDLYQIVSVPVFSSFGVMGTITLGTPFENSDAMRLKRNTSLDVAFFLNKKLIAYSDSSVSENSYLELASKYSILSDSLINNLAISEPIDAKVNKEPVLAFISPLGSGENAYYFAYVNKARQFEILTLLQENILLIGITCVVIVIPLSIILSNLLAGPIKILTQAMLKVRKGDFTVSVKPKTRDEIGILTRTFNEMIQGLRERFALSKYVGDHTLEMIKKNEDIDLGSQATFKELTILFTDIRGSTKKIATSTPELFLEKLNRTLGKQADSVLKYSGSIDKYVGDSVIAIFAGTDSLESAIKASIEIQKEFKADKNLNSFFDGIGIGINYGQVILGNMGAKERMDYTIIGSQVNLCARLCSKAENGQILIPSNLITNYELDHPVSFSSIGEEVLKGFNEKIEISTVNYD